MRVLPNQPFQIIYALFNHEYLGYLLEAFVVQLDTKGQLTLLHQTLSSKNVEAFANGLDESDIQAVKYIDALHQEVIWKKFSNKKLSPVDFFIKVFDQQKGDKLLQENLIDYVDKIKAQLLPLIIDKQLFVMGSDGNPTWQEIKVLPEKATVLFHFMRNHDGTHYFPTIKYAGQKVEFQYKKAFVICDEPAWLVCENRLYHFAKEVDGKKLRPFLQKKFIAIPKKIEDDYYRKFITAIITHFDVYVKGFEVRSEAYPCRPILNISEQKITKNVLALNLFDTEVEEDEACKECEVVLNLVFQYGNYSFRFDSFSSAVNVSMEKNGDDFIFHKVRRDLTKERQTITLLKNKGLDMKTGRVSLPKNKVFSWIQQHYKALQAAGFELKQSVEPNNKRYFLGYSTIEVDIKEGNDWFDIYAKVRFGEFEMPFIKLKDIILKKKREFTLPNGEVAVIPEVWFTQYAELFAFIEHQDNRLILSKYHLSLVQDLGRESLASVVMSRKLEKLRDFTEIESYPVPVNFEGVLRPYQKAGYDWMQFLRQYNFGGCLADDMGLGKTVMTLALLQSQKEMGVHKPSLLIMPTSLIYNWQLEAQKFTPQLKVLIYTGSGREKNTEKFDNYDLVLTSYGIVRMDVDLLEEYPFHYVILDESQAIKNPQSNIAKAVRGLQSRYRLVLTGTPLENSTLDIWSQLSFVNPGLLGSQSFFKNEYMLAIDKKNDEKKIQRLYSIIKPFLLRRHKSQVATELPPKIETIQYCEMTEEQATYYEKEKSYYRNLILEHIEESGFAKSQMIVLQGLTKLRQIANHPRLIDSNYTGDSGKMEDVLWKLKTTIEEGHKILIFSQFVKHLTLLKVHFDEVGIQYAYLDGSTTNRQAQVEEFQQQTDIKVFLISLKAGGLGLNLTAADYVFILDPWWNPAIEAQAIDRAYRIGQDKTVFTYKFITKNTVEEKIVMLQQNKQRLANELISTEESFVKALSKEDIISLLS
jgi:superfamily II DNA or RNA helicase